MDLKKQQRRQHNLLLILIRGNTERLKRTPEGGRRRKVKNEANQTLDVLSNSNNKIEGTAVSNNKS